MISSTDLYIHNTAPWGMRLDVKTLPEWLRQETAGGSSSYVSHIVGKWNLGHASHQLLPTSRGFDSFFGFLGGAVSE